MAAHELHNMRLGTREPCSACSVCRSAFKLSQLEDALSGSMPRLQLKNLNEEMFKSSAYINNVYCIAKDQVAALSHMLCVLNGAMHDVPPVTRRAAGCCSTSSMRRGEVRLLLAPGQTLRAPGRS